MRFSEIMANLSPEAGRIPEGWKQGRATYGGLTAAMLFGSLERILPDDRPALWASVSLIGPSDPGEVTMTPRILRQGRNVIQGECHMHQSGQPVAALQASFGARRDSALSVAPRRAPDYPPPESCRELPRVEGVMPEFLQHFDLALARGGLPYSGSQESSLGGWMRFREPVGAITPTLMLALVDCWPPAILPMMERPSPVSTLSWTVQFLQQSGTDLTGDSWWQYQAATEACDHGYAQTTGRIWSGEGRLMAISQQTIAVFD